jgi:hypothetical protein
MITAPDTHDVKPRNVDFARLLDIVRGEYLEMPGLRLTKQQAQRLWALDLATCDELLDTLVGAQFLRRTHGGEYMLAYRAQ